MIVVIGAGPAGLAVAHELHRGGRRVVVLDAAERVGGTYAAVSIGDVPIDRGRPGFDPSMPAAARDLLETVIDLEARRASERIRIAGRWLPLPATPISLVRHLPPSLVARVATDMVATRLRPSRGDTYAEAVRRTIGSTLWRRAHEPWAWKVWGTRPDSLGGEGSREDRQPAGGAERPSLRLLGARQPSLRPRAGFGAAWEALAARLPDVRLSTKVTGLLEHDDRVIVGLADGRILTASHVFSTVAPEVTAQWLTGAASGHLHVPRRSLVLVYLTLDRRPYSSFDAHVLPDRSVLPTRVSEPMNTRDRSADPTDRTVLCAEIPCWSGDAVWRASDSELALRVCDDLVRSCLPDPRPVAVECRRVSDAYPVVTPSSILTIERVEAALGRSRRVVALDDGDLAAAIRSARRLPTSPRRAAAARGG